MVLLPPPTKMRVLIKPHQNSIQAAVRGTWRLGHVSAVELVSAAGEPDEAKKGIL